MQLIFQDLSTLERIRSLEDNAETILEDFAYELPLDDDEINEANGEYTAREMEILKIQADKARVVAEYNAKLKGFSAQQEKLLQEIKTRRREFRGTCYEIVDESEGTILTYNQNGELIGKRPARMYQRKAHLRTGTDQ